jgi:hypothetical protein
MEGISESNSKLRKSKGSNNASVPTKFGSETHKY